MRFVYLIDRINTFIGKTVSWAIVVLTLAVCYEVFARYVLRAPTEWAFDASYMLYGLLFMVAGPYALARNNHVRGDFLYRNWPARRQAGLDLVLYFLFFFPGILALIYAGIPFTEMSWMMREHSMNS
ncbi:MAG: TRAP transporter small permease subunit, partial [Microvirga sp.]